MAFQLATEAEHGFEKLTDPSFGFLVGPWQTWVAARLVNILPLVVMAMTIITIITIIIIIIIIIIIVIVIQVGTRGDLGGGSSNQSWRGAHLRLRGVWTQPRLSLVAAIVRTVLPEVSKIFFSTYVDFTIR